MNKRLRLLVIFVLLSGGILLIGTLAVNAGESSTRDIDIEEFIPIVIKQPPAYVSKLFETGGFPPGDIRIIGVIESLIDQPLYNISVLVRGYDLDEQTFVTYTVTTILTATLPDQGNIFDFNTNRQSFVDPTAEVIAWEDTSSVLYAPVSVLSVDTFPISEGQFITVTLQNEQPQTLQDIVGLFWHETGTYYHELEFITDILEPGEIYVYTTFVYMNPWVEPNIIIQGRVDP